MLDLRAIFSDYPDIVTSDEFCKIMKISKNSGYRLFRSGKIQYIRIGRKYLIPKQSIFQFINEQLEYHKTKE